MTIEEKLDWILQKVKSDDFDLGKIDQETKKLSYQSLREELYGKFKPLSDEEKFSIHEWEQLLDKLIQEDRLIEDFAFSFGNKYVLTIRGKLFEGYVNEKLEKSSEKKRIRRLETNQLRTNCWMLILTVLLALGTLYPMLKDLVLFIVSK